MFVGPAAIRARRPSGSPVGSSYATSSGPKHSRQAKLGPSGKRAPHSRQDSATAGPKALVVDGVVASTVCTAMCGEASLLIFPAADLAAGRTWHRPRRGLAVRVPAGGLPGLQ